MSQWLFDRYSAEDSSLRPNFALYGTTNWLRALSIVAQEELSDDVISGCFNSVTPRAVNSVEENVVFQRLLMALHNLASLKVFTGISEEQAYSVVRSAIVSWYYGIYTSCGAMVAAKDGSSHETHTKTAKVWGRMFAATNILPAPFNYYVPSLVKSDYESQIVLLRDGNTQDVNTAPTSLEEAKGAILGYLKGSAKWYREKAEEDVRRTPQFKALNVSNFRTTTARNIRDEILRRRPMNFLHQAIRYRGKANYRDSLYLSYGNDYSSKIHTLVSDLHITLNWFLKIAWAYSSKKIPATTWEDFTRDLGANIRLSVDFDIQ